MINREHEAPGGIHTISLVSNRVVTFTTPNRTSSPASLKKCIQAVKLGRLVIVIVIVIAILILILILLY